jgi:phage terminase large subunit-like protein
VIARSRRILHKATNSYFEVISSVADAQHGANLHGAIVDELHVHPTPDLVEALETGTGSRSQPLVVIITTADDGRLDTIYARKRERIEKLARKVLVDESTYGVIWAAAEADNPFSEATWQKANPGFGISPTRAYLRRAAKEAEQSPADLAKFLRLHLGVRTKQDARYIDLKVWDRNAGPASTRPSSRGGSATAASTLPPPVTCPRSHGCSRTATGRSTCCGGTGHPKPNSATSTSAPPGSRRCGCATAGSS